MAPAWWRPTVLPTSRRVSKAAGRLDVRDVRHTRIVARLFDDNDWRGLTLAGRNGYLFGNHGDVSVLDLADPAAPRLIGVMPYPVGSDGQGQVQAVAVSGSLALVAYISDGLSEPGLAAWDVSDPAHPRLLSQTFHGIGVAAIALDGDGHLAYISPAQDQPVGRPLTPGVVVLDVSDRLGCARSGTGSTRGCPRCGG